MKAVNLKTIVAAFTIMLLSISTTFAQKNPHNVGVVGKGPHGGTVQEADPNHAEILVKDGKVFLYILDGDAKAMSNAGITGKALFQFADGTTINETLVASGTDGFVVSNAKAATYKNCILTATVKGKSVSSKFKNYTTAKPAAATTHHH